MPATNRKGKKDRESTGSDAPPSSGRGGSKKRKNDSGWPWWLWVVGALALLVVLGGHLTQSRPDPAKVAKASQATKEKAAILAKAKSASTKEVKAEKKAKELTDDKGSPMHLLTVALRLQEMTEIATTLQSAGEMTADVVKTLSLELSAVEEDIKSGEGRGDAKTLRDLLAMVSVVRGTLVQHSSNLTDEEVAQLNDSWTYANPNYWDDYYNKTTSDERFDWYGSWDDPLELIDGPAGEGASTLGNLMKEHIPQEKLILMFGCGNSDLSERMYEKGYNNMINIDISQSLLDGLKDRLQAKMPKMQWLLMSGEEMTFADGHFDAIIDKGTLDAIEQNPDLQQRSMKEVHRTLKSGGVLVSVTYNDAETRIANQLRAHANWGECVKYTFDRHGEANKRRYYMHVCKKL